MRLFLSLQMKGVTSSQRKEKKKGDRIRAWALKISFLENFTAVDKELIKSPKVAKLKECTTKQQPANDLPSKMCQVLGLFAERLEQRMEMIIQKDIKKYRRLRLYVEH